MRNERKRKNLRIVLIALGIGVLLIILVFLGLELIKRAKITSFEISLENVTCTDNAEVAKYLQGLNINYFGFIQNQFSTNFKKKFFCIGEVNASVVYPSKLKFSASGRKPVFAIASLTPNIEMNPVVDLPEKLPEATESSQTAVPVKVLDRILKDLEHATASATYLVDEEGMIFQEINSSELTHVLILGEELKIGKQIKDGQIEKVGKVSTKLKELDLPTDNMVIIADKLIIDFKPRIIFALNKRLDYQTASLQLILSQAKMNSDPAKKDTSIIESIDLRFNKPVVIYSKIKN